MSPLVFALIPLCCAAMAQAAPLSSHGHGEHGDHGAPHHLRDVRLREAVDRGELTPEEARVLGRFERWHLRSPPDGDGALPAERAPRALRWRDRRDSVPE